VSLVTHVHDTVEVGDESDGYPEAWYLPAANDILDGYAMKDIWYDFFTGKAATKFGKMWCPGYAVAQYPNADRASTNWYHDHTLGMTHQNVYAGPGGFYIIRGGPSGDNTVTDFNTGLTAKLSGPAPKPNDKFPSNKTYYEIPIVIQDRSFNHLTAMEPRVLWKYDYGEWKHVAIIDCRITALPTAFPQGLPVAVPYSGF